MMAPVRHSPRDLPKYSDKGSQTAFTIYSHKTAIYTRTHTSVRPRTSLRNYHPCVLTYPWACRGAVKHWVLVETVFQRHRLTTCIQGRHPDAVNLWIGNDRSVTSIHCGALIRGHTAIACFDQHLRLDPYENIYHVVRGCKVFTLLPPSEGWCLNGTSSRPPIMKHL